LIEFFRSACEGLREGATIGTAELGAVRALLRERRRELESNLPSNLGPLREEFLQASLAFEDALDALELAFAEDTPEMADWIVIRAQDADETLRSIEQTILQHSTMLSEESD
jgi:hypothetical protein